MRTKPGVCQAAACAGVSATGASSEPRAAASETRIRGVFGMGGAVYRPGASPASAEGRSRAASSDSDVEPAVGFEPTT